MSRMWPSTARGYTCDLWSRGRALQEVHMGLETPFFAGALILFAALIYGSWHYSQRDRIKSKLADQTVRDRYEHNET